MTYEEYAENYPIRQNRNTGGYGFRRHGDGFDLSQCPHESEDDAEQARRQAWDREVVNWRDETF